MSSSPLLDMRLAGWFWDDHSFSAQERGQWQTISENAVNKNGGTCPGSHQESTLS